MKSIKITTNGRITIPACHPELVEGCEKKYKLTPGKKVRFEEAENGIIITPLFTKKEIKANVGCLGLKRKMRRSLIEEKKIEKLL